MSVCSVFKYRQLSLNIVKYCQVCQSSPTIVKHHQLPPSITKYCQMSPNIAKYCKVLPRVESCIHRDNQILGSITKYFKEQRLLSPSIAKNCQILSRVESSVPKYHQVLPSITKYFQVSPSIAKSRVFCPLPTPSSQGRGAAWGRFQLSHTNHPPTNSYKTRTQLFSTQVHDIQVCPRLFLSGHVLNAAALFKLVFANTSTVCYFSLMNLNARPLQN